VDVTTSKILRMPTCPECGQPTPYASRCESCQAVETALTPRSSPAIEPPRRTVTFPLLVEAGGTPARRRIGLWIAVAAALAALVSVAVYAMLV
jgi:hypothetical protein